MFDGFVLFVEDSHFRASCGLLVGFYVSETSPNNKVPIIDSVHRCNNFLLEDKWECLYFINTGKTY